MVSREELSKMIENGETFYWEHETNGNYYATALTYPILFSDYSLHDNFLAIVNFDAQMEWVLYYEDLYKTKEECWRANKYATREERFEPPTWEEIVDDRDFEFVFTKDNTVYDLEVGAAFIWIYEKKLYAMDWEPKWCFESTKENYTKAVELARKLFLGETNV